MLKKRGIVSILLINLCFTVLGGTVLELIFGNWIHADNLNRLNIIRSRCIEYETRGLYDTAPTTSIYTRDQYGLRGSFERPSEIDILTVGGSTTDQRYITDGQTWQDVIQHRFQSIGKKVILANAGIDGQSTLGHIKNFEWWFPHIPNLKPRFVLFYVGLNDFYRDEDRHYDSITDQENGFLRNLLREKSAIYHLIRTLHGMYQAEVVYGIGHKRVDFSKVEWTTVPQQDSYDLLMDGRLKNYDRRLNILISRTQEFGSTSVFVTQPSRRYRIRNGRVEGVTDKLNNTAPINGVDYYYIMKRFNEVAMSVSMRNGIVCLDMASETVWEDADFYDLSHMTPRGAHKVGDYLFERLKEEF